MTISIGTLSYAAAAAAYCFLSVLLIVSWRGRIAGALLTIAALLTVLWAGTMAYQATGPNAVKLPGEVLEILHKAGWFAFLFVLLGYARANDRASEQRLRRLAFGSLSACVLVAMLAVGLRLLPDSDLMRDMRFLTGIVVPGIMALGGMLLVEHLYRNTNPQQRWSLKFLCLGLGGFFAFDFYLFSDAMLFRRINGEIWDARGVVAVLVAPLLAVSAARNPTWSLSVSVSRQVVFHSTTLLGAAGYLLVMATAGYYIRFFGGTWGGLLQITFLFGAGVLLVLMLFSGVVRARLKVFLSKHFFSYRYDYREEWLRFTRSLSEIQDGSRVQERCIEALAQLVESQGGALWLRQEDGRFARTSQWNLPSVEVEDIEEGEFSRYLARRQWVVDLDEIRTSPEVYESVGLPQAISSVPQAWLVVPLVLNETLHGMVLLQRSRGRLSLNWEISDLLKTAGTQAASYVAQAQAADALARAKQFESFNKMSAFVVHDLKNLVAQLSLLLRNAQKHKHNPEFQEDMLGTIESSVAKMNKILMQLRSGGLPIEKPVAVSLAPIVRRAVEAKQVYDPKPRLMADAADILVVASPERLERVVGHLVQNALEATPPDGQVDVIVGRKGGDAYVEVRDTGRGMSAEFVRDSLFKPFESTKSNGMGIGTYESREYIRELGGTMDVESTPGTGTRFVISLPLAEASRTSPINDRVMREGAG
jgi:putative PEP-CTERM system histidine kinase